MHCVKLERDAWVVCCPNPALTKLFVEVEIANNEIAVRRGSCPETPVETLLPMVYARRRANNVPTTKKRMSPDCFASGFGRTALGCNNLPENVSYG